MWHVILLPSTLSPRYTCESCRVLQKEEVLCLPVFAGWDALDDEEDRGGEGEFRLLFFFPHQHRPTRSSRYCCVHSDIRGVVLTACLASFETFSAGLVDYHELEWRERRRRGQGQ